MLPNPIGWIFLPRIIKAYTKLHKFSCHQVMNLRINFHSSVAILSCPYRKKDLNHLRIIDHS